MSRIRTLVVDDEPLARKTLRLLLAQDDEVEIIDECRNGQEAVQRIRTESPDLIFLDVQMPHMSGLEVVEAVGEGKMPVTIFVTAYDTYAVKAFEAEALDYLLKPFDDDRFRKTLKRAKTAIRQSSADRRPEQAFSRIRPTGESTPNQSPVSRLMLSANGKVIFLKAEDIDWINAADYYVEICSQKRTFLQRETLDRLEKKLDPQKFFRIHRSTIVNIDRVKEIRPSLNGNYVVLLHDGTTLKMSRRRRQQLKGLL
jgi:two-component system, LytTR family, response regulator